ncbi:Translation initiation factor 3 subunit c, partial [Ceratobasidium sp. UAMH 11750]
MSRFFRAGNDSSDSDSSSSEEEELLSDDESGSEAPAQAAPQRPMARFLRKEGASSSSSSSDTDDDEEDSDASDKPKKKKKDIYPGSDTDSEDEGPRTVKSAFQRRVEEMQAIETAIENALKINDWNAINNEFDKFGRVVHRQTNLNDPVPSLFLKLLKSLESGISEAQAHEKTATKKMNATNARALTSVKQKIRRSSKEHEAAIKSYENDPGAYEAAENREPAVAPTTGPKKKKVRLEDEEDEEEDDAFQTVGRSGKTMTFSTEALYKNLQEIQEARGRKNTDRNSQMHLLEQITPTAVSPYGKIRVLLALISARFDYNPTASFMPIELWQKALKEINTLVNLLLAEPLYLVAETTDDYDELVERVPTDGKPLIVRGSIVASVERLDDEFNKSLLNIDPHGTEYVERLKDEPGLYALICLAQRYFEARNQEETTHRVVIKRLEHIYCKPDAVIQHFESSLPNASSPLPPSPELLTSLATKLYKSPSPLLRTRAMLAHIYHTGLQNDFPRA